VVFDTVDLHFLRESREAAYKDNYKRQSITSSSPSNSLVAGASHHSEGEHGGMLDAVFSSSSGSGTNLKERLLTQSKAARSQVRTE